VKSSTSRWVSGDDFFNREPELQVLESRVRDGNHVLLTGQRRMGKTSMAQELGRRLESRGWVFLFADVHGATCPEDVIAYIAEAAHPIRPLVSRTFGMMRRWIARNIEEIGAREFRVRFRGGLSAGNWRRYGEELIENCARHDKPVLLVIDELSIFLVRISSDNGGVRRVDEFLSWLRGTLQRLKGNSPVLLVSGSIGLTPLVHRLGIPDRINHLDPFHLRPWSRETSVECFERLAASHGLPIDDGVACAVYEALGIGIPQHVQSFFARLREFTMMRKHERVTTDHVAEVYRTALLGPPGQSDLAHYETRLEEGLGDESSYAIAMEILAEAATRNTFTQTARRGLEQLYSEVIEDAPRRVTETLDALVHDGYLEPGDGGHRFPSRLLKDWWAARFRDHHTPLENRLPDER